MCPPRSPIPFPRSAPTFPSLNLLLFDRERLERKVRGALGRGGDRGAPGVPLTPRLSPSPPPRWFRSAAPGARCPPSCGSSTRTCSGASRGCGPGCRRGTPSSARVRGGLGCPEPQNPLFLVFFPGASRFFPLAEYAEHLERHLRLYTEAARRLGTQGERVRPGPGTPEPGGHPQTLLSTPNSAPGILGYLQILAPPNSRCPLNSCCPPTLMSPSNSWCPSKPSSASPNPAAPFRIRGSPRPWRLPVLVTPPKSWCPHSLRSRPPIPDCSSTLVTPKFPM